MAAGGPVVLRPYREHVLVKGAGRTLCLRCGQTVVARTRGWQFVCPGMGEMRTVLRDALFQGAFDASILSAGGRAISLAAERGRDLRGAFPLPAPD